MKNFCKKFCKLLFLSIVPFFVSCAEDDSKEVILDPNNNVYVYHIYPNDLAQNDSAAVDLAHGVTLAVHPNATYQLSFDVDPNFDAPKLQLFRLYQNNNRWNYSNVRSIKPDLVQGRYVYSFVCEENAPATWITTLALDDTYYPGKIKNLRFTGEGIYSDHFSINLILVGNIEQEIEDYTIDEFASALLQEFRKQYTSVTIDTIYINRAEKHPTLGAKYPANEPWLAGYSSDDFFLAELGGWPGVENALDVVLVHYINKDGVLGYSRPFGANLGAGYGSTVILGTYLKTPYGEEPIPMQDIIETTLHEMGHFFGLRHTTATLADIQILSDGFDFGDYSNLDDGLDDTPFCGSFFKTLLKITDTDAYDSRVMQKIYLASNEASSEASKCPDADNYMFPVTVTNKELKFSAQQLDIIRKNLMIFPH